jgi:sugar phosphate isomerase/epimerase
MKFAICNETFQDWPFDRGCAFAAECGYTGLEIAPFTLAKYAYDISPQRRAEARRQIEAAGLQTVGLHWLLAQTEGFYLTTPDDGVRSQSATYLAELAGLCRDLGGRVMVLGSPMQRNLLRGVSHEEGLKFAADVLQAAVPAFEKNDVVLAVEPLGPQEGNFLNTADLGVRLIEMVDSPHVRLHLDVKAMSTESRPIPDILRENLKYLEHFHANDPNRRGPGMGEVDFLPIFAALQDIDYQGWVSVEVFDYTPGPERLARESVEYMRRCWDQVAKS